MLNKALRKRSTEKARKIVLKKTLRKVLSLNEVLKIVFLLKKAFPKKNDSRVHKHIQESAQKSHPKSGQGKKFSKKCSKKVLRKAVWLKSGLKKIIFLQKNAQKSFFCQKSPHKSQRSKKHSK